MDTHHITSLVLFLFNLHYGSGAQVFNCPPNQINFEKLIGLRPNINELNTLLYRNRNSKPITFECIEICTKTKNCSSFLLNYQTNECYSFDDVTLPLANYDYNSNPEENVVWFRKVCSVINPYCQNKAWNFEIVSGAEFIGYNTKYLGTTTRQQCMNSCMQENSFLCRSIKFYAENTNTLDAVGICTLSEMDRHLIPNSFRVSRFENEYIENQCVNTSVNDYCTYEEYENTTLKHDDYFVTTKSENDCRNLCDTLPTFNCRGYSVTFLSNRSYNCFLHSEDSKLVGPKLLAHQDGTTYYERVRCLNVSVSCTDQQMIITYLPEQPFNGRIYANGYSDQLPCYADGRYNSSVILQIPLGKNMCGVQEEQSSLTSSRILRSVLLVIQYNALIQTQVDRYVRVGCTYGDGIDEITLDTNVNFTGSYPNKGSTVINNSSVLPTVTIRVVDYDTKAPTADTQIGQELQLIIEIKPGNGPYDMWAGHLVASSDNGQDSILLLDDNGCPTQLQIFPQFTKIVTNESRILVATFQAFKFTSSSVVRFSVMVHFCAVSCPPTVCPNTSKIKREASYGESNATVLPINGTNGNYIQEMPLNVLLIVRGVITQSNQLITDKDNKIVIATSDLFNNEVCINYVLFIGLAISWIILQIIILVCCFILIRRYKKYFDIAYTRHLDETTLGETHQSFGLGGENLSRRVHWADQ